MQSDFLDTSQRKGMGFTNETSRDRNAHFKTSQNPTIQRYDVTKGREIFYNHLRMKHLKPVKAWVSISVKSSVWIINQDNSKWIVLQTNQQSSNPWLQGRRRRHWQEGAEKDQKKEEVRRRRKRKKKNWVFPLKVKLQLTRERKLSWLGNWLFALWKGESTVACRVPRRRQPDMKRRCEKARPRRTIRLFKCCSELLQMCCCRVSSQAGKNTKKKSFHNQ